MSSGRVGQAFVLTCFFTAGYGQHRKLGVGFRTTGYVRHRSQWVKICRNLQILKKMLEKSIQFLSSEQPCELKSLDAALNIAGSTLEAI